MKAIFNATCSLTVCFNNEFSKIHPQVHISIAKTNIVKWNYISQNMEYFEFHLQYLPIPAALPKGNSKAEALSF
jgi:hypothetical protein